MNACNKICVIVGAGDFNGFNFAYEERDIFFIAADGGYAYLEGLGIKPALWIGDSDSLDERALISQECDRIDLPVMKDDTDIFAAVKHALSEGYEEFHIYGCLGGRLDHTVANIRILSYLTSIGKRAFLFGPGQAMTATENGSISFSQKEKGIISVFSMTDISEGVTISGLKYETEKIKLLETDSIGVSNAFTGSESSISVEKGRLLIMLGGLEEMPGIVRS